MHVPGRISVIPDGMVHGAAIVPEHQIVDLPPVTVDEGRLRCVLEEVLQQRQTLFLRHVDELSSKSWIYEQRPLAAHRMGAHHRMLNRRRLFLFRVGAGGAASMGKEV